MCGEALVQRTLVLETAFVEPCAAYARVYSGACMLEYVIYIGGITICCTKVNAHALRKGGRSLGMPGEDWITCLDHQGIASY